MVDWKAIFCLLLHNAWKSFTSPSSWGDPLAPQKAQACVQFASTLGCEWALFGADLSSPGGDLSDPDPLKPPQPCLYVTDPAFGHLIPDPALKSRCC